MRRDSLGDLLQEEPTVTPEGLELLASVDPRKPFEPFVTEKLGLAVGPREELDIVRRCLSRVSDVMEGDVQGGDAAQRGDNSE